MHHLSSAIWRSSTYSGNGGECVQVADGFSSILPVRDSKDPEGPALVFPAAAWNHFLTGVKAGAFPAS